MQDPTAQPSSARKPGLAITNQALPTRQLGAAQNQQREVVNQLRLLLCSTLQTSLDVEELLRLFFNQLEPLLGISGLEFTSSSQWRKRQFSLGKAAIHSFSYQLSTGDQEVGELCCYSRKRVSGLNIEVLEAAAGTLVYPLHNALLFQQTLACAEADCLTGLGNRQALQKTLPTMVAAAKRYQRPLSILMLDIDHFKRINDEFGHSAGDQVIVAVADAIRDVARDSDIAYRFGGEEYLLILDNTDGIGAAVAAERLRKRIESLSPHEHVPGPITVSIGSAAWSADESPSALIVRADAALYRAKAAGRNRSVAA
ncbi:MAG: GGDEF domain-containing protein [Pseudomonadales bacterium]|nr:GGDEF domain-containing protein [Pseudomonadales bacterium]